MKTFVLIFKEPFRVETYSSLSAIFEAHNKDDLKVSKYTLDRIDFLIDFYENDKIRIDRTYTKSTGDVRRDKENFL